MNILYLALTFLFGLITGTVFVYYFLKRKKCSKQNWHETYDAIKDPIAILDFNGKILQANEAMKFFNSQYVISENINYCYEIIHNTKHHIEGCPLVLSKDSFQREEKEITFGEKTYLISIDPIFKNNKIIKFVHIIKDITKIKELKMNMEEEKRKFETLVNNLPGFVYRCANDKNWTMQYISDGCLTVTGYAPEDFINNKTISFNDIIMKKYQEYLWNKWQQVLSEKGTFQDEYEIKTKDGCKKWVWERGRGIYDNNGNLLFLEGFITDITDKNIIFNALQESEEKFKVLSNSTTASIFIYQNDKFIYTNPATTELTGYSTDELLEINFWDVVHPNYKELVKERGRMRLLGIPQPPNYDFKIVRKNGEERWVKFSAGYLTNYKGKPAAIGTAIDITDLIDIQSKLQESIAQLEESERLLKQQNEEYVSLNEELTQNNQQILKLNEELIIAKEKAEASDRLKTSFLNNISHEIRTPLNAILGFTDLLSKRNVTPEKTSQYLSIIKASGNHLLNVINNIINVATIEAGEEKLYYKQTNINQLINNAIQAISPLISNKNIELQVVKYLPENKKWILTDETKLNQILSNLLTNSIKFTDNGYVHVSISQEEQQLVLIVKDSGIGIEESIQPYIFERFMKVEAIAKKHPNSGMGIGLSLVKSYVTLMGGSISLNSKVDVGSEFTIILPYLPVQKINEPLYKDEYVFDIPAKKILLVEDTQTNIDLIKEILEPYPLTIEIAYNGKEAIQKFKENQDIALIFIDIKMPEMDGYQACKEILKINIKKVPIIGLTAYAFEEEFEKMQLCGMETYLIKPVDKTHLLSTLEKYLKD